MQTFLNRHRAELVIVTLFVVVCAFLFVTMAHRRIVQYRDWDYQSQMRDAIRFVDEHDTITPRPNFLYVLILTISYRYVPALALDTTSTIVTGGFLVLTGITLFAIVRTVAPKPLTAWAAVLVAVLALCLAIIMPFNLLSHTPHDLYYGYVPIHPYHNPTIIALMPFALAVAFFAVLAFTPSAERRPPWVLGFAGVMTALSVIAKPNYVLALLPAMGLYWLYHAVYRKRPVDWGLLIAIGGVAVPILIWQYVFNYGRSGQEHESSIAFDPFYFFEVHAGGVSWRLAVKFVLSILFPLAVYVLYFPRARHDVGLNLSWLVFGMGAFHTYFLTETGFRATHGNFTWSGVITLLVLFVLSVLFVLRQTPAIWRGPFRVRDWRFWACVGVFGLHVASGVVWFVANLNGDFRP
jgi:hypothetical protein